MPGSAPDNRLQRLLGKGFSIAAGIGFVIGLGILRTPGEIATTINEPLPYMALWVVCAAFVLLSLLVVAELIAMTPRTGGIYALVAHAYGPYPGFLIGWSDWVANSASMALKAFVLAEYVALLEPRLALLVLRDVALAMSTAHEGDVPIGDVRSSKIYFDGRRAQLRGQQRRECRVGQTGRGEDADRAP